MNIETDNVKLWFGDVEVDSFQSDGGLDDFLDAARYTPEPCRHSPPFQTFAASFTMTNIGGKLKSRRLKKALKKHRNDRKLTWREDRAVRWYNLMNMFRFN